MAAQKDFYKTLGVTETASADEIKKAYRKLAKKYHPDVNGGDKAKEAKFKELSEAYDTVGDAKKRQEYDTARKNPFPSGFPSGFGGFGGAGAGPRGRGKRGMDMGDIDIEELFSRVGGGGFPGGGGPFGGAGAGGAGGAPSGARGKRTQRGADLQTTIDLTLPEAALGSEKSLTLEPQANGGRPLTMRIPAGVEDEETIKVPGQGRPGRGGGPPGDLLVKVHVLPHATLRRKGADLETDVTIHLDQAVLGTRAEVHTLEGTAQVTVPPGTSSGQKLRLRGKGAGDRKGGRGDLYAFIQILVPKQISDEAKELIEQFAKLTRGTAP